jgi:hypothetical protein
MSAKTTLRNRAGITRFFDGLDLLEPGIVPVNQWRPGRAADTAQPLAAYCGLGCKH